MMTDKNDSSVKNLAGSVVEVGKWIKDRLAKQNADDEFAALRKEAGEIAQQLAPDPTNSVLVQRTIDCVRQFEELSSRKLSKPNADRSIVNQSILSVRVRSTHYSAFIAGRYGESDKIGSKFKSWIYNVAAHGSIETAVLIDGLLKASKKNSERDLIATAKLFRSSAMSDASRFLEWSRKHDEKSALRLYNSARVDILSNVPDQVRFGIGRLRDIDPPGDNWEAPDVCWHEDNWTSFSNDKTLQEIIEREAAQAYETIKENLKRNHLKAASIRETHGDIWVKEYNPNRAAIASFAAVMVAVGSYAYEHPAMVGDAFDFSRHLFDYLQGIFSTTIDPHGTIITASLGDGGLANPTRFARAVFGDGGLA